MPIVLVRCSGGITTEDKHSFAQYLQFVVAKNLDVPENPKARLLPIDVEVSFHASSSDIYNYDIEVKVFATKFEERTMNIQDRSDKMAVEFRNLMGSHLKKATGFFYVCLVDAGFSEF